MRRRNIPAPQKEHMIGALRCENIAMQQNAGGAMRRDMVQVRERIVGTSASRNHASRAYLSFFAD
jgi:hypothetical protein